MIQAREGFFTMKNASPAPVTQSWNSVFMVLGDKGNSYKIGTAFLVKKEINDKETTLYFVTSEHFLRPFCSKEGLCTNTALIQNAHLKKERSGIQIRNLQGWNFDQVELIRKSRNPDVALLRVRVTTNERDLPTPLPISRTCFLSKGDPLWTVGFPDISIRNFPSLVPIENQDSIVKRWSSGVFVRFNKSDYNNNSRTQRWAGTTVDALGGNSGGPLLNAQGEVVGVMKNSASTVENNFRYMGYESHETLSWQSNAVRCEYFVRFLNQALDSR